MPKKTIDKLQKAAILEARKMMAEAERLDCNEAETRSWRLWYVLKRNPSCFRNNCTNYGSQIKRLSGAEEAK